jgi:hypothetical protein
VVSETFLQLGIAPADVEKEGRRCSP